MIDRVAQNNGIFIDSQCDPFHRHRSVSHDPPYDKICNAFEEMLTERMPLVQKYLRKGYDGLQIPIEKWKEIESVANSLYILIKPLEWVFLVVLYFVEKEPEFKIGKQYLPFIESQAAKKINSPTIGNTIQREQL